MRLACLIPVVLLAACASAPRAPAPTPASATPPVAANSTTTSATASSAAPHDTKFDQIDAANLAEAQAAGYKVVNEKGNTLLCRKNLITGTRLKYITTCLTAAEWKETSDNARDAVKPNPAWKPERGN